MWDGSEMYHEIDVTPPPAARSRRQTPVAPIPQSTKSGSSTFVSEEEDDEDVAEEEQKKPDQPIPGRSSSVDVTMSDVGRRWRGTKLTGKFYRQNLEEKYGDINI